MLGEKMANLGMANGWAGVVINGAVRDVEMLGGIDFAVFALASAPPRGRDAGAGESGVPLSFGGVRFEPGDLLCADLNGVVVVERASLRALAIENSGQRTAMARRILIEPGRPMQNGYIESFNGKFRDECNAQWLRRHR